MVAFKIGLELSWQSRDGGKDLSEGATSESGVDNCASSMFVVQGWNSTLFRAFVSASELAASEKPSRAIELRVALENMPDIKFGRCESGGGLGRGASWTDMLTCSRFATVCRSSSATVPVTRLEDVMRCCFAKTSHSL